MTARVSVFLDVSDPPGWGRGGCQTRKKDDMEILEWLVVLVAVSLGVWLAIILL